MNNIITIQSSLNIKYDNSIVYNVDSIIYDDDRFSINLSSWKARFMFNNYSIDCIYLYRKHNYKFIYDDIKNYLPKLKKSGYMCGVGYNEAYIDVMNAVNDTIGEPDIIFETGEWIYNVK